MSRSGSIIFLFIFAFGCTRGVQSTGSMSLALPGSVEEYIGLRHPPLPVGLDDQAGYLINPEAEAEYTVSYIARASGEMLWLERLTHRNDFGHPFFEVRAVLPLPQLSNQEFVIFGQCRLNGATDPEIIAIVGRTDEEVYTEIRQAWRANRRTERFDPFPLDGLTCINESHGA